MKGVTDVRHVLPDSRNLLVELTAFYALIHIEWLLNKVLSHYKPGVPRVALLSLKEQAQSDREIMQCSLASLIFDYLALACLGEARHAYAHSNGALDGWEWDSSSERIVVVEHYAGKLAPSDFLPKLITLFDEANWSTSFGGKKWGRIAKVALSYFNKEWNEITLIDHCVDLVHNNGLCFDKGFLLRHNGNDSALKDLLDDKASRKPLHKWRGSQDLSGCVWSLIRKLQGHKIINSVNRTKWCPICELSHPNFNDDESFLLGNNHFTKSLADDGYLGIEWPTSNAEAEESIGEVMIDKDDAPGHAMCGGCFLNNDEPCDGECGNCDLNHGGCEFNGYEKCDGECGECDEYHPGCDLNDNEQCSGECSQCKYNEGGCEKNDNEPCNGDCSKCHHHPDDCTDDCHHGCDGDCEDCKYHAKENEEDDEEEEEADDEIHDLAWELKQPVVVNLELQPPLFEILNGHVIINAKPDKILLTTQELLQKSLATTSYGEIFSGDGTLNLTTEQPDFEQLFLDNDKLVFIIIK